jgi:hypothetical protein
MVITGNPKKGRRFSETTLQEKITGDCICEGRRLINAAALWFRLKISMMTT